MKRTLPKFVFKRKDSPTLWYKFKVNGKVYTGSTETADVKAAEIIVTGKRGDAVQGKVQAKPTGILLADLIKRYLELCRKQPAYATKEDGLNNILACPRFAKKKAAEITREDCRFYQAWRTDTVKQSTVNRELGNLRNMYNVAIEDMRMKLENPVANLEFFSEKKFERKRHMTTEEKDAFFSDPQTPQATKDVVMFDIKTGLRQGELRALTVADVDFKNKKIRVLAGEEDDTRHVPMFPAVEEILRRWVASAKAKATKYVFHNNDGTALSRHGWIVTAFEWARKRGMTDAKGNATGLFEDLHFHDLRHTFASDFIMRGGDFKTLGIYMGHKTSTMTERYAHVTPDFKASQILLLPPEKAYQNGPQSPKPSYAGATLAKTHTVK